MFLSVFCLFYRVFKGSHGEKILGVFEVFLGVFEKNKEKKARVDLNIIEKRCGENVRDNVIMT